MNKLLVKNPFLLLTIPAILMYFACNGYGFVFRAAVTGSCLLILAVLSRKRLMLDSDVWYVLVAFVFSIIGDWFMSHKGSSFLMFSSGVGAFFLAHVGFLAFALKNGRIKKVFTAVLLAVYLVFYIFWLYPAIESTLLMVSVLLYLLISCISLGAALGISTSPVVRQWYSIGIALLFFSDTIIAFREFAALPQLSFLILPTYFASHIFLTLAIISKTVISNNEAKAEVNE